ncbi:glycosyltransferase [Hymenobacter polaris]|nr:glycosyltransferase family A protein [Hymenobacter polaris]
MIPTYNCTPYLAEAINSVLMQDMGEENMQIEVVDDASTDADVAQLVATLGKGRIRYFRQVANVGSLRNFETCLNRSQGQWVHLLHGDDRVAPGFYTEIATLFHQYPEAGAAFTNTANLQMHATGVEVKDRPPIVPKAGLLPDLLLRLAEGQQLETPSMVVKRSVYEQLGGFFAVHYGEDWIMWARIAAHFPVAYSPKCLAHYRYLNNTSITHHSIREGQNVRDITKVLTIINQYLPVEHRKRLKAIGLRNYAYYCLSLSEGLSATDKRAAIKQLRGALKMSQHSGIILWSLKIYLKTLLNFKRLKLDPSNSQ